MRIAFKNPLMFCFTKSKVCFESEIILIYFLCFYLKTIFIYNSLFLIISHICTIILYTNLKKFKTIKTEFLNIAYFLFLRIKNYFIFLKIIFILQKINMKTISDHQFTYFSLKLN